MLDFKPCELKRAVDGGKKVKGRKVYRNNAEYLKQEAHFLLFNIVFG
jgi:hypothetical protein